MMSMVAIREIADEQGRWAEANGTLPYVIRSQDDLDRIERERHFPFPNIGSWEPVGWEPTEKELFCDKMGVEPGDGIALSPTELLAQLEVGKAYAITEEGQFQLYVTEYTPPRWALTELPDGR